MNDERFFDLAMKDITRRSTDAERAELASLLASQPELKAEFDRLRADARFAKEVLPLVDAAESSTGEFPGYARERLQTKVRQTLGSPVVAKTKPGLGWRWWWVLAPATALLVLLLLPLFSSSNQLVVQVAMLDIAGGTRGTASNEITMLHQAWEHSPVQSFDKVEALEAWEKNWSNRGKKAVIKIVYDRTAAEVRVLGRRDGQSFQKTFPVDRDFTTTLKQVDAFIRDQTKR